MSLLARALVGSGRAVATLPDGRRPGREHLRWVTYDQGRARLVSATQNAAGDLLLGLQYQIAPGLGDLLAVTGRRGVSDDYRLEWLRKPWRPSLQWPRPHRFQIFELETFGYKDEVVSPDRCATTAPREAVDVRAAVNFLTCREICVPHTLSMALDLPAAGAMDRLISDLRRLSITYRAQIPPRDGRGPVGGAGRGRQRQAWSVAAGCCAFGCALQRPRCLC